MVEVMYLNLDFPTKAKTETRAWWTVVIWMWVQEAGGKEWDEWVRRGEKASQGEFWVDHHCGHLRPIPSEAPWEPERNEPPNCSTEGSEGGASNLWSSSQLTVALTLELPVSILQGSTYSWLNQPRLKRKPWVERRRAAGGGKLAASTRSAH